MKSKLSALEKIVESLDHTSVEQSKPSKVNASFPMPRTVSTDTIPVSILSGSPAYQQIYVNENDKPGFDYSDYLDNNFGLTTPPKWTLNAAKVNYSFDGNVNHDVPPPKATNPNYKSLFSASLPLPRPVTTVRSQSAPRIRGKGTPTKLPGKSISQKLRGGQRAGKIDRWCLSIGSHVKVCCASHISIK